MNELDIQANPANESETTANDRFKRSFSSWFWGSITGATALHFAIFAWLPSMQAEDMSFTETEIEVLDAVPEVEIPPPPEAIRRPATPVITTAQIDEEITIEVTSFDNWTAEDLPPPPDQAETRDISAAPTFVVRTQDPVLLNEPEVTRNIQREYPALLKDAGLGGTTIIHLFINEQGVVEKTLVSVPSPHKGLDDAALKVGLVARFSPAKNRDKTVALWIELPITFKAT
jgi:TonB family protein